MRRSRLRADPLARIGILFNDHVVNFRRYLANMLPYEPDSGAAPCRPFVISCLGLYRTLGSTTGANLELPGRCYVQQFKIRNSRGTAHEKLDCHRIFLHHNNWIS